MFGWEVLPTEHAADVDPNIDFEDKADIFEDDLKAFDQV